MTNSFAARAAQAGTLPKLMRLNAREHPNETALREKELGCWRTFTWADYQARVRDFYARVAQISGLPETIVTRSRGFIRDAYVKHLRAAEGKKTSLKIGTEVPVPVTTFTAAQTGAPSRRTVAYRTRPLTIPIRCWIAIVSSS